MYSVRGDDNTGADKSALRHLRKLMERPEMTKKARIKKLPGCMAKNLNKMSTSVTYQELTGN